MIYLEAEETEDDEVAAAVLQAPPTVVPEDLVPTLTDKTFDITKETHDLLVVDFYQPCKMLHTLHYLLLAEKKSTPLSF